MRITKATVVALALLAFSLVAVVASSGTASRLASAQTAASVRIRDFKFEPRELTVKAGTTVTWTNEEGSHTVTSDEGAFASPTLTAGKTYARKFTRPGTYRYHCSFHGSAGGGMSGTVVVTR
ncbi:MAG TPA: plastocyanin/azurin family copper-binding protein [Pyrinomonadaceae bacterium]|nr:plastocyanin/azurin family copper-binding protein [Pyrinomonadaceae bacterium]